MRCGSRIHNNHKGNTWNANVEMKWSNWFQRFLKKKQQHISKSQRNALTKKDICSLADGHNGVDPRVGATTWSRRFSCCADCWSRSKRCARHSYRSIEFTCVHHPSIEHNCTTRYRCVNALKDQLRTGQYIGVTGGGYSICEQQHLWALLGEPSGIISDGVYFFHLHIPLSLIAARTTFYWIVLG